MDNIEVNNILPRKKSLLFWFKYYKKSVTITRSSWFKILNLENKKVSQYEFIFYVYTKSLYLILYIWEKLVVSFWKLNIRKY